MQTSDSQQKQFFSRWVFGDRKSFIG